MRSSFLVIGLVTFGALGRWPLGGAEITASGIAVPFFNEAGELTHKLLAKSGSKAGNVQMLRDVEVHYFSAGEPKSVIQKLETTEASWDERAQTLTGSGRLVVVTAENRLSGDGFDFAPATSRLQIHRNFTMSNPELLLTSDRATVDLIVEKIGDRMKLRDVKRCEASGHLQILVQPTASKKYGFERLHSETAIYEGETQVITLPQRSRTLSRGLEMTSQTLTIHLKDSAPAGKATAPR